MQDFLLNKKNLQKIEWLLPRLKYSVLPLKIIEWLENFDNKDRDNALDFITTVC